MFTDLNHTNLPQLPVSKDKLTNRILYVMSKQSASGVSVSSVANRLKVADQTRVKEVMDQAVSKGYATTKDSGRVYNGLPVVLYVWKGK